MSTASCPRRGSRGWPRWAAARAIARLDIGGSIGIDLPTLHGKEERRAGATDRRCLSSEAVREDRDQRLRLCPDRPAAGGDRRCLNSPRIARRSKRGRSCAAAGRSIGRATVTAHPAVIAAIGRAMARAARAPGRWRRHLAGRPLARHVGRPCRTKAKIARSAASPRAPARAFLRPRMQGPRPAEMARRRLSDSRPAR